MTLKKNNTQTETQEVILKRKNKLNKIVIAIFIVIIILTILMKVVDGALQDFGFGIDDMRTSGGTGQTFTRSFWLDPAIVAEAKTGTNHALTSMVNHHPNFLWMLTQFTWITTFLILAFLIFRIFKFDSTLPRWLKWIMTQRTLSLIVMYDIIVGVVFWSSMFSSFESAFNPNLKALELTLTIFVHAFIPVFFFLYSAIFLIRDGEASALRHLFVFKGMIYPTVYMFYYLLVAVVWSDPYAITDLHNNFVGNIWKLPVALLAIWIMLGIMLLIHNWLLTKFNKLYDPQNDREVIKRRDDKILKIQNKARRKAHREERHNIELKELKEIKKQKERKKSS